MTEAPGITYILALPYSGSSLFSLALGTSEGIINVGEAMFLQNDWNPAETCSCGTQLWQCPFWSEAAAAMSTLKAAGHAGLSLQGGQHLDPIDARRRKLTEYLKLIFGLHPEKIFGRSHVQTYADKHAALTEHLLRHHHAWQLIDASKSAVRLRVLIDYFNIPVRIIVLRRSNAALLGARIKRARRRLRWYFQVFSIFYIAWLLYHLNSTRRAFRSFPSRRILEVKLEDFLSDPDSTSHRLSEWYGRPVSFSIDSSNMLDFSNVHVYTGNSWLLRFKGQEKKIRVRTSSDEPELTWFELSALRVAQRFFPQLRD